MTNEKELSELQALIIRLFPPHDYGEDSNVEELYNRCTDLESEVERLQGEKKEERKKVLTEVIKAIRDIGVLAEGDSQYIVSVYQSDIYKAIERLKQ